jgi:hypothetical protein
MGFKGTNVVSRSEKQKRSVVQYDEAGVYVVVFLCSWNAVPWVSSRCSNEACGRAGLDCPDNGSLRRQSSVYRRYSHLCVTNQTGLVVSPRAGYPNRKGVEQRTKILSCLHFLSLSLFFALYYFIPYLLLRSFLIRKFVSTYFFIWVIFNYLRIK